MSNEVEKVKPYDSGRGKKQQIEAMFDNISGKYDFLNHLLSMGIDKSWRRNLINLLSKENPKSVLDVATGTGDLAILIAKKLVEVKITGIDLSNGMLEIGRDKIKKLGLLEVIDLKQADSENLPFNDGTFDSVTVAFGVRNFENLQKGLEECFRVTKAGGSMFILEFSSPQNKLFKLIFNTYFKYVLPIIGRITSKDPKAYYYLFESVQAFPSYEQFTDIMKKAGFGSNIYYIQSLGICTIYHGKKI